MVLNPGRNVGIASGYSEVLETEVQRKKKDGISEREERLKEVVNVRDGYVDVKQQENDCMGNQHLRQICNSTFNVFSGKFTLCPPFSQFD
jgi:hypothetical protein